MKTKWVTAYQVSIFFLYTWVIYHLAYAKGSYVEMMSANNRLQNCHAIITMRDLK